MDAPTIDIETAEYDFIEVAAITSAPDIPPETVEACKQIVVEAHREKIYEQTYSGFGLFERYFQLHYGKAWRERRQGRRGPCEYCRMNEADIEQWKENHK